MSTDDEEMLTTRNHDDLVNIINRDDKKSLETWQWILSEYGIIRLPWDIPLLLDEPPTGHLPSEHHTPPFCNYISQQKVPGDNSACSKAKPNTDSDF